VSAKQRESSDECASRGSKTLAESARYRVYARGRSVVACDARRGRRQRLGANPSDARNETAQAVERVRLEGNFVAFVITGADEIALFSFKRRARVDVGTTGCAFGSQGPLVRAFDLDGSGRLVWSCSAASGADNRVEVRKFDRNGGALLDESTSRVTSTGEETGDPINPLTVALSQTLTSGTDSHALAYWVRGAGARVARLR